jgi:hypothetical protein
VEVIPDLGRYDVAPGPAATLAPRPMPDEHAPLALPSSGPPMPSPRPDPAPAPPSPVTSAAPAKRPVALMAVAALVLLGVLGVVASQLLR